MKTKFSHFIISYGEYIFSFSPIFVPLAFARTVGERRGGSGRFSLLLFLLLEYNRDFGRIRNQEAVATGKTDKKIILHLPTLKERSLSDTGITSKKIILPLQLGVVEVMKDENKKIGSAMTFCAPKSKNCEFLQADKCNVIILPITTILSTV